MTGRRPPAAAGAGAPAGGPRRDERRVSAVLVLVVIGFAVQQTAIVPAIHDVQDALHTTPEWASWLVTVYLMVATVATPAMGRLGDLHGRRRMLLVGVGVFAAASVGAALAPNLAVLLGCRSVQGIGGAVYPLTLAIARDVSTPPRTGRVIALLTGAFGVGTAVGFVGGGWLAATVSWRAIFGAGAALVAISFVVALRSVPDVGDRASGRFDLAGTALLGTSSISLLAALTLVVSLGWLTAATVGLFALAVVSAAAWVRHERRTADPLIDLHVLTVRPVAVANLATVGLGWALFGSFLLIPEFSRAPASSGYGLAAGSFAVGLILLPLAVGQTVCGPLSGVLSAVTARWRFAAGLLLIAAGTAWLAVTRSGAAPTALAALLLGAGSGIALQAGSATATEGVEANVAAVSAAVNSTVRRLAGGIGGQVNAILLASLLASSGEPAFAAFTVSYLVAAGLCVLGVLVLAVAVPRASRAS